MPPKLPPKLCPKIILEGTRLTHKTDIAFKLNEHPQIVGPRKYRYHAPIISAEWCGFTNFPWGRGLINFEPQEEEMAMETYRTWARLFELLKYYSWIVDRFHLSTIVYQLRQGRHYDFKWLEERLAPLGFCIVFCTRTKESFARAREKRVKISGEPKQYGDLSVFIEEQEKFRKALSTSTLPHLEVDMSNDDVELACQTIADWLKENDLLRFRT
ncbi:MAG: hypothetical protein AMJ92_02205 [candidate division Zixibacteria bacterium SM23_81]|nr:MAG: hypothetical protein AMJ92_02205 [candidate division Zixibacteria bacterium SM23_81]